MEEDKEKVDLNNLKQKYIMTFDEFVKKGEAPWKTPEELSRATGTTVTQVYTVVQTFDEFVKNSKGEVSTREKYEQETPFIKKIVDQITNKIK